MSREGILQAVGRYKIHLCMPWSGKDEVRGKWGRKPHLEAGSRTGNRPNS